MPTQGDLGAASTSTEGTTAMSTGLIGDRDALRTYMYFQRIAWKADIINRIVGQTHGLPEALDDVVDGEHFLFRAQRLTLVQQVVVYRSI